MPSRKITAIENLSQDSKKLFDVLNDSSDMAVVLVATSFLDASLGSLLRRFLIDSSVSEKLIEARGILGSFAARSDMAYVLGLIDKPMYRDLLTIAEIRNEFAHHHLEQDFNISSIAKLCGRLTCIESLRDAGTDKLLGLERIGRTTRDKFVLTVAMISQRLLIKGLETKRRETK